MAPDGAPAPGIRYRLSYAKGEPVRYISHLDLVRTLERAFRRAGLPLAYSHGFNPHPRISVAAPLALGWTCDADVVDVDMARDCDPRVLCEAVCAALPQGVAVTSARALGPDAPTAMSQVEQASYVVRARVAVGSGPQVEAGVRRLLASTTAVVPRRAARTGAARTLDVRPLIVGLEARSLGKDGGGGGAGVEHVLLRMDLRVGSSANAKPEHVLAALAPPALEAIAIHRSTLWLSPEPQRAQPAGTA